MTRFSLLIFSIVVSPLLASNASAHPLGDNAVNRHAAIELNNDRIQIQYLLDMAEIPTLFASQSADTDLDDSVSASEWQQFASDEANTLRSSLIVNLSNTRLELQLRNANWAIKPGNAGLSVLRLAFDYTATIPVGSNGGTFLYQDPSAPSQPGWKGITVKAGKGVELISTDAGSDDPTRGLTVYPPSASVLRDQTSAHAQWSFASRAPIQPSELLATPAPAPAKYGIPVALPEAKIVDQIADRPADVGSFFLLGIHHIAIGWDHLAFLLGLLLLTPAWRALVKVITAFTAAHSLTLTLAAFGFVYVPGAWVEPAIAATVAYVGWLSLAGKKTGHGVGMAFGFGLIHGLGFAGAFAETLGQSSLASGQLLDLLSFNLGIEVFQLALIGLAVPARAWLMRYTWSFAAQRFAAFGVMSFGLAWLFLRTFGAQLGEMT